MKLIKYFVIILSFSFCTSVVFAKQEAHSKKIPHGIQKKINSGKPLPPGWQKKLEVGKSVPQEVVENSKVVVPVDKDGIVTVEVDNKIIRLLQATNEIVEILK